MKLKYLTVNDPWLYIFTSVSSGEKDNYLPSLFKRLVSEVLESY